MGAADFTNWHARGRLDAFPATSITAADGFVRSQVRYNHQAWGRRSRIRLGRFRSLWLGTPQPLFQLVGKSKDHTTGAARHPVNRKAALDLPTPHRALVALKKRGNLLPGVETFLGMGWRGR